MLGSLRHPIDKVGSTASFSYEDAFPSVTLSVKNLNLLLMIVIVKTIEIMLMLHDEC